MQTVIMAVMFVITMMTLKIMKQSFSDVTGITFLMFRPEITIHTTLIPHAKKHF